MELSHFIISKILLERRRENKKKMGMSCTGRGGENSEENDRGGVLQGYDILNIGKEARVRGEGEI